MVWKESVAMNVAWSLNTAWMISCGRAARHFRRSLRDVRQAQWRVLERIIRANGGCEFGRRYGFAEMRSLDDFRRRVPPTTWEDIAPSVERISSGEQGVLTSERVELLQPTS